MNDINTVNDYFSELELQFERAYENSLNEDSFDSEYFNLYAPSIVITGESGEIILNETLESAYYDKSMDRAIFVPHPNGSKVSILNCSSAVIERVGLNMVFRNVQIDLYHEDVGLYTVTLYRM